MPKPLKMMKREHLERCYDLYKNGAFVSKIMAKLKDIHNVDITHPTLSKMLEYYKIYDEAEGELKKKYELSIFPQWLEEADTIIAAQPTDIWGYRGRMPDGNWVRNDCLKCYGRGYYWEEEYEERGDVKELVAKRKVRCCQGLENNADS